MYENQELATESWLAHQRQCLPQSEDGFEYKVGHCGEAPIHCLVLLL